MNRVVIALVIMGIIISISSVVFYISHVEETESLAIPEDTNLTLYVSNQSFDNRLVNIKVSIDDNLRIDQDFDVGDQHEFYPFYFNLEQGNHVIQVDTKDASYQKEFTIEDELWIAATYWYDQDDTETPMIIVDVSNAPIGFM